MRHKVVVTFCCLKLNLGVKLQTCAPRCTVLLSANFQDNCNSEQDLYFQFILIKLASSQNPRGLWIKMQAGNFEVHRLDLMLNDGTYLLWRHLVVVSK